MATKTFDFEFKRGDTKIVVFGITDKEGNSLNLGSADEIYFTLKKNASSNDYVIQKKLSTQEITYNDGQAYIKFSHDETKKLKAISYFYDIQVDLNFNEFVETVWEGEMTLLQDVTSD